MNKSTDDMTEAEYWAWVEQQRAASRQRFAGDPVPRISAAKRDHPHWEQVGWAFRLRPGPRGLVRIQGAAGSARAAVDGMLRGLRPVADGGPQALVVDLGSDGTWALRRADGVSEHWSQDPGADHVKVQHLDVPVRAWQVPADAVDAQPLPAPEQTHEWTARTGQLEEDT